MDLRVTDSLAAVDVARWNLLAGDNALMAHGWLAAADASGPNSSASRYLLLEEDGRLVAAGVCHVDAPGQGFESVDDLLFGRLAATPVGRWLSLRPALVCGLPWSTGSGCLTLPAVSAEHQSRWIDRLIAGISRMASERGYSVVFPAVSEVESNVMERLASADFVSAVHEPIFALDIDWSDFEGYRSSLTSKNIRKNIRRELNKNRRLGIEIEALEDPRPEQAVLHRIVDRHYQRFGWPRFPYGPGWFGALKRSLGRDALICVARQNGRPVGVSVSVRLQGVRQMLIACVDHAAASDTLAHFNLAYYWPVADCIRAGDRRYVVGPGQYLSRIRRGYRPVSSRVYCRPHGRIRHLAIRAWMPLLSAWMRSKIPREGH